MRKSIPRYSYLRRPSTPSLRCLQTHERLVAPALQVPRTMCEKEWRCVMRKFIAALALISLIAVPMAAQNASAAPVSPSSSAFGGNGY